MAYKIIEHKNKKFIKVPRLEDLGLKNCFTSIDMDLGMSTNKSMDKLRENYEIIFDFLEVESRDIYYGRQVHSNNIRIIGEELGGEEGQVGRFFPDTDGLITGEKNLALLIRYADCIPIIIYDPVKKVQANLHSGWKGTLSKIGTRGLDLMINNFSSKPEDLIVVMGPAIGRDDFEVSQDLMEEFSKSFTFSQEVIRRKNQEKYLIDLKGIVRRLFLEEGIREDNLIDIDLSTYSTPYLHSYRRDKEKFGLMGCLTLFK